MGEASAGQLLALSIRMAVGLRYDVDPDFEDVHPPASWLNKEMRRRLWWTLCAMEVTDCSLRDHVSRMVSDADQPLLDRIPVLHDSSRRVRAPAPDAMFESVRTEDGLPAMVPFRPGHDLHCAEQSVRLTRIFAEIQDLGAEMNRIVKDASSNAGRRPSHGAEGSLPSTDDAIGYRQHILRRQELERKLDAWLDQLPEWARNVTQHHVFTASTASQFPPPWQLVSVLLVYHECYVALYLPTLFAAYSGGLCPPPDDFHRLVSLHRYHCGKVSQIIEHVLRIDPSVMHVSLIGAYFTFYSSIALAVVMKTQYSMCQDDDVTPTPEQSEDMADLRKQFGLRVTWLKIFAESWYLGGYLASVVEGFMEDNAVQATV
ncbi:hypothetical protein BC832DRAFT_409634 [Gaertneriomyces semiglobifer]|nr:hypothetical protein BC832DRAFT_409634 [Gaertneriomyces semiglobifer]